MRSQKSGPPCSLNDSSPWIDQSNRHLQEGDDGQVDPHNRDDATDEPEGPPPTFVFRHLKANECKDGHHHKGSDPRVRNNWIPRARIIRKVTFIDSRNSSVSSMIPRFF